MGRHVSCTCRQRKDHERFVPGTGFPPDAIENLFDPFFTTKAPGEGTGLGLSICARLIEGMGGTIEAANRDSGGARFVIRLPAMYSVDEPENESVTETS